MRIKRISVRGLFKVFDHTIPLNMEDRITIMHGPNGFGKTILLHMLDDLFNSRYSIFRRVPFTEFRVDLDNGDSLRVIKKADQHGKETVRVHSAGKEYDVTSPDRRHIPRMSMIERLVPELERVGSRQWLNTVTGHTLSLEQVLDTYGIIGDDPPEWLKQLQGSFHTRFIRTERLSVHSPTPKSRYLLEHGESAVPAAVDYSQDLARTIEQSLARSVELSSSLDRSFPMRLVSPTSRELAPDLGEEELRQELQDLEEKRSRLMAAGLLDKGDPTVRIPEGDIDPVTRSVLSIYVKDAQEKLQVFDEILGKIELMQELINKRFLYKKFAVSKEEGFVFRTPEGSILSPDDLSSGEQHEIVLLYELLFKVQPDTLVLIDEPEISLHIAWQQEFLSDLARITSLSDFDVIIATHSPDIVSDRWDLTVELKGPEDRL